MKGSPSGSDEGEFLKGRDEVESIRNAEEESLEERG